MRRYLIWSFFHGQWWGWNQTGYVSEVKFAGRYNAEEAMQILCNDVTRRNMPVRVDEAHDDRWPANQAAKKEKAARV